MASSALWAVFDETVSTAASVLETMRAAAAAVDRNALLGTANRAIAQHAISRIGVEAEHKARLGN